MVDFGFNYRKREIRIDVRECRTIFQKASGLMFRKKSKPLLFYFKKLCREPIHSFFCVPFIAIWLDKNKIVDVKLIKSWKISIKPKKDFDRLLEIPINDKYFSYFVEDKKDLNTKSA